MSIKGSIIAVSEKCSCGSSWTRKDDPSINKSVPVCSSCGDAPFRYALFRSMGAKKVDFRYFRDGSIATSLEDVQRLSDDISAMEAAGTLVHSHYHKRPTMEQIKSFGEFIEWDILATKGHLFMEEEKEFLQDFAGAFFADMHLYRITQKHIEDFLNTFHLKLDRRVWAKGLVQRALECAYEELEGDVA